jgi:hypothetical protein
MTKTRNEFGFREEAIEELTRLNYRYIHQEGWTLFTKDGIPDRRGIVEFVRGKWILTTYSIRKG